MSALICGSLAYDTIMVFPDRFRNHILPEKVHILNVSFLVPEMRREFGGVAELVQYAGNGAVIGNARSRHLCNLGFDVVLEFGTDAVALRPAQLQHRAEVFEESFKRRGRHDIR